jgi:hypothetical protein
MQIEIDTDELQHLKEYAFNTGDAELKTNCQMLKYYCKIIHKYFKSHQAYLVRYHSMRSPVIITDKKNWYVPNKLERNSAYPYKMCLSSMYGKMNMHKRNSTHKPKV